MGGTIRSGHGQGAVREQGRRGAQVLDGSLRPLCHPHRRDRPGLYRWVITLEGRSIREGTAPSRDKAADAVSTALRELPG
jgi:hypothetical protein